MNVSDKRTAIIYGSAGAVAGGVYGFTHPSAKTIDKIYSLTQPLSETYKNYHDSFDKNAAHAAVVNGDIDLLTSTKIKQIISALKNVVDAEVKVDEIFNTPQNERSQTLKSAIKEAKQAHKNMRKQISFLKDKELFKKLEDLGIINKTLFLDTLTQATGDLLTRIKLVFPKTIISAGIGAASFILVGLGLKSLFNKNAEKTLK